MTNKLSGSYYTPPKLAEWISRRVVEQLANDGSNYLKILEPSCGDGVFLGALESCANPNYTFSIDAVELNTSAINQAKQSYKAKYYNCDFLLWKACDEYDLVIGNPPYIAKKFLKTDQIDLCKEIHVSLSLKDKEISNIWTAFVLKSSSLLNSTGILAFVLPTELLQVNYAKEIRDFLLKQFERVEIISFRNLAFNDLDQDTVILIAYKKSTDKGLFFEEVNSLEEMNSSISFGNFTASSDLKWTSYILDQNDIDFVNKLLTQSNNMSYYCRSVAGIVTAANSYFIVDDQVVDEYELHKFVKPIIQKGIFVNGSIEVSPKDFEALRENGKPCNLIDLTNYPENDLSDKAKIYLGIGTDRKIPERYKCQLRERWFDVPSIWKSEGFFFKRGHTYPKLLVNKADVYVTDAAYRIVVNDGYDMQSIAMTFYNSLTLLCAELYGRYYGGGVLEVTPNEFKSLPLPGYSKKTDSEYKKFTKSFKGKTSIDSLLVENNKSVLQENFNMTANDINRVHKIYQKVRQRRLKESLLNA